MEKLLTDSASIRAFLDRLTAEKYSGEASFTNGEMSAKLYYNQGKTIWGIAAGQRENFQTILIKEHHIPREQIMAGIRESRKAGKKHLDEILLDLGIKDPLARSSIISRQTFLAIEALLSWPQCRAVVSGRDGSSPQPQEPLRETAPRVEPHAPGALAQSPITRPTERPSNLPPPTAQLAAELKTPLQVLERLRQEIPLFIAAMVVDNSTGMPILTLTDLQDLDVEATSAYYRDLLKAAAEALVVISARHASQPVEEVLITSSENYILLRSLKNGDQILFVLIDKESNPGMARIVMKRYIDFLGKLLT